MIKRVLDFKVVKFRGRIISMSIDAIYMTEMAKGKRKEIIIEEFYDNRPTHKIPKLLKSGLLIYFIVLIRFHLKDLASDC